MANIESPIQGEGYTPPGGQLRIDQTDRTPLVTNKPVEVSPPSEPKGEPQTEKLFEMKPEPQEEAHQDQRQTTPVRGHLAMLGDVGAGKKKALEELARQDEQDAETTAQS